ncbi:MAG: isochorismatase family cysteine hydrolase [Candidatus Thiodiazotropha sp.]
MAEPITGDNFFTNRIFSPVLNIPIRYNLNQSRHPEFHWQAVVILLIVLILIGFIGGEMNWKQAYRSFYYEGAPEPRDLELQYRNTALLTIDIQNTYMKPAEDPIERERWAPFRTRMNEIVIPTISDLQNRFRRKGIDVLHARIACLLDDGRDRSLSQKKPGWNYLLLPLNTEDSQIVPELSPATGEIVVSKTTDSALTGTNLRLVLHNMGIENVIMGGIFTDQCVSSTVRSLADESFNVVVVEDCCAAGTDNLHYRELEIINMIYCHVISSQELIEIMNLT